MNKIITLFTSVFILVACSSETDSILETPDKNEQQYEVTIKSELPAIEVETSPLNTRYGRYEVQEGYPIFYNIVLYKLTGEVFFEATYDAAYDFTGLYDRPNTIFGFDGKTIAANLILPAGEYKVAFMVYRKDAKHPHTSILAIDGFYVDSEVTRHYETDTFGWHFIGAPASVDIHNGGIYYNIADMIVTTNSSDQTLSMKLQPMWSYIDININDAQTFDVPEGTNALQFDLNPNYFGFGVKSKLAVYKDERPIIASLDSIRANATFKLRTVVSETAAENNTIQAKIHYLKIDSDTTVLDTRELKLPENKLQNGHVYNINGKLGSQSSGQSMNITLGQFNKEDVVIEF